MVTLKPSLASYARIAYARELSGDPPARSRRCSSRWTPPAASRSRRPGRRSSSASSSSAAAVSTRRAPVPRRARDLPGLRLRARAVRARRGGPRPSRRGGRATRAVPSTRSRCRSSSACSGTCSSARARGGQAPARDGGRDRAAARRRNGVRVDLESAVYRADHRIRPAQTVALARKARADRPSIYGDDALGWALARAGRCDEAVDLVAAVAAGSAPGMRCSGSTVATPQGVPATRPG